MATVELSEKQSKIFEAIKEELACILRLTFDDLNEISPNDTLVNIGCDSLDQVELVLELEKRYMISISDDELYDAKTILDLIKVIETKI